MTNCRDVKHALIEDALTDEVRAHIETCEPCAELATGPELAVTLSAEQPADPIPDAAQMFASLNLQIDADRTLIGWLKSRPTWMRRAIAALSVLGAALFGLLFVPRPDFDAYPQARMAISIVLLTTMIWTSLAYGLRPMQKKPLTRTMVAAVVLAAVVLSFALALAPNPYQPEEFIVAEENVVLYALRCLYIGTLVGLPVYVVGRMLDRVRDPHHALMGAGAGHLTGQLVLLLHCPIWEPMHLFFGHACLALVFTLLVEASVRIEQRLRARSPKASSPSF